MQSSASLETFGSVLREYRLAAGFSQEMLAEQARISTEAVGALERGARKLPQRQTLTLLIDALRLQEHERKRLSLAAVRPPQPRRRDGAWFVDVSRVAEVPADAIDTLGRICDRLDGISAALELAANCSCRGRARVD